MSGSMPLEANFCKVNNHECLRANYVISIFCGPPRRLISRKLKKTRILWGRYGDFFQARCRSHGFEHYSEGARICTYNSPVHIAGSRPFSLQVVLLRVTLCDRDSPLL